MIAEASNQLEELLRRELYPEVLTSPDAVSLCVPRHENQEYLIGIYLYDLQEDATQRISYTRVIDGTRRYPDRNMTLSYVIFINEETRFGGYHKELEEELLERLIQVFHDHVSMQIDGKEIMMQFEHMTLENKIRFWSSLHKPLQPALYVKLSPVPVASRKTDQVDQVKQVQIDTKQKGEM